MRVRYVPEARTELTEAAIFYEDRRPGLGERFLAVIRGTEKLVGAFPHSGTIIGVAGERHAVRRIRVHGFPYSLIYLQRVRTVWILAVAHRRRRPGYWRERRPASC